jgi:aliphatic nitrilase
MGMTSREAGTLYNAMLFIDNSGEIMGYRRKLVPTVAERTVWGRGDGSDLQVFDTEVGKLGGLICGENNMYLVKYALLAKGEQIHVANFPGSPIKPMAGFNQAIDLILRCSATLGQIFILNAINYVSDEMIEMIFDSEEKKNAFYIDDNNGGASIISPRGTYLAEPVLNKEMIIYADIDMEMIIESKWSADCIGHYARPDVTKLVINETKNILLESSTSFAGSASDINNAEFANDLKNMLGEVDKSGNSALKNLFENFVRKYT